MPRPTRRLPVFALLGLAACADNAADPRGVDRSETLLSVSASDQAESRPDHAQFQAGIETLAATAKEVSRALYIRDAGGTRGQT